MATSLFRCWKWSSLMPAHIILFDILIMWPLKLTIMGRSATLMTLRTPHTGSNMEGGERERERGQEMTNKIKLVWTDSQPLKWWLPEGSQCGLAACDIKTSGRSNHSFICVPAAVTTWTKENRPGNSEKLPKLRTTMLSHCTCSNVQVNHSCRNMTVLGQYWSD